MSLQNFRMPRLADKIEAQAEKKQIEVLEAKFEQEDIQDLKVEKIIKKKSRKQ